MSQDSRPDIASLAKMRPSRKKRGLWAVGMVAVVLAGGIWFSSGSEAKLVYDTKPVLVEDLIETVIATGTVQPTTKVELSSELSGTIIGVEVDFNEIVKEGQVLARLDDTKLAAQVLNAEASLARARAGLASAEASVMESQDAHERAASLDQRGLNARNVYISAKAAYDRALAAVESAKAEVTLAEANLALQQADLEKAIIRSPINGTVLSRAVEKGQIVAASLNAPILFTLAEDLKRMELRVSVDEADIGRVQTGQNATFTVDAYPGRNFNAQITSLRVAPDDTDGDVVSYTAILSVDNNDLLLRPGMTATATIVVARQEDAMVVPAAALRYAPPVTAQSRSGGSGGTGLVGLIMPGPGAGRAQRGGGAGDGSSLWVLRAGTPERVTVETGAASGSNIAVSSEELRAEDLVILGQREAK